MNKSLFLSLEQALKKDSRFISNDENQILLKNVIRQSAEQLDETLISLMLDDKNLRETFFKPISDVIVFDSKKFITFLNNKEFLPDSYTAFKNKVGLSNTKGDYLSDSDEVVLSFPYKDCVLAGGQDKEDIKRQEVFYNEVLGRDEIDRLLDPKTFTNFKKYTNAGEEKLSGFTRGDDETIKDNLIIKGNNLLALHSLKKEFAGKVKLIYIDPPYNTGNDSFNYNDRFNHSTWLTFMKNRLEVARDLLRDDGGIFLHVDHHEIGYLNVLLDSVFGMGNKVQIISIKTASPAGFKTVNPGPIDVTEYVLFYTKNKASFNFKKGYVPVAYNKNYNLFLEKKGELKDWKFTPIKHKILEYVGFDSEKEAKDKYGDLWKTVYEAILGDFAYKNAENIVSIRDPHKPTDTVKNKMIQSKDKGIVIEHKRDSGSSLYLYNGGALAFYSNKMQKINGKMEVTELLTDFWNHISWAGIANEGGVKLKNGKKPEKLLKQIFDISTEPGDIVLDYHLGSGTTAAVAHKMGRQYIGVEQMDYIETISVERMKKVIEGEQGGVSKSVEWKGGGEFVYMEMMEANQKYLDKISGAKDTKTLLALYKEIQESGFINYYVDIKTIDKNISEFEGLSLDNQKRFLADLLDKNLLYVNHSEIEDVNYGVSDEDKELNREFYK